MVTVVKEFDDVVFEWDSGKEAENIAKHQNITFEEALTVLLKDDNALTNEDTRDYGGEQRFITIGLSTAGRLLYVVWTFRDVRYRMISARKANKHEQRGYYHG